MGTVIRNHKKKIIIGLAAAMVVALVAVLAINLTKPYAVYADGTKVRDPYAVKAGDQEMFLVKDKETAEKVVADVMEKYSPEGAIINSITIDKKLTSDAKDLKRGDEPPVALKESEAVDRIIEQNETDDPYFNVTINSEVGTIKDVKKGTTYKKNEKLYKGEKKMKSEGSNGDQIVTNQVISVNGRVVTSEVIDTVIINEAVNSVVYKGTKEKPKAGAAGAMGGTVLGSGYGGTVASFALQFVGNPYVYGGTSLTHGADCSGFTMSVYSKFGIGLPHSSGAQASVGKGVPYSQAKAGDIICYPGHVAIYIGGGKIVHASTPSGGIKVSSAHSCGPIKSVRRVIE